eukprot:m.32839 g.32839  ORF g.32839 m.32839 type:complete len:188 (+) comp16708_c1_seq1:50-613(+)
MSQISMLSLLLLPLAASMAVSNKVSSSCNEPKCLGSTIFHAHTYIDATISGGSCWDLVTEIEARCEGKGGWVDPHNNGSYSFLGNVTNTDGSIAVTTQRTTGKAPHYLDKQTFILTPAANDAMSCGISSCSVSQTASVADFSTNYCDLRMLYCGVADGCKTVTYNTTATETCVSASSGQHSASDCLQ